LSFSHSLEFTKKYHISGDLLATNLATIEKVIKSIFGQNNVRLKSENEILVRTSKVSLDIYSRASNAKNDKDYLLGGSFFDDEKYSIEIFYELASKLEQYDIIYSLELYDESDMNKSPLSIQHSEF
jgi:hypothetical protein